MLVVRVFGGLGNQMFQYAFFEYLREKNEEVYLDLSEYKISNHHEGYELNKIFHLNNSIEDIAKLRSISNNHNNLLLRFLQKKFHVRILRTSEYIENKEVSFVDLMKISNDTYFYGYWQDTRYIYAIEEKIRNIFSFPLFMDEKNIRFSKILKDHNSSVSVHIRRGDYLNHKNLNDICNEKYYTEAIEYIITHVDNPLFVFFSDDIKWCKEHFKKWNAVFVDWNYGSESWRDMQLMSMCRNNIIANSTFSWWGAWLNSNPDKIVVCPSKWTRGCEINKLCDSIVVKI